MAHLVIETHQTTAKIINSKRGGGEEPKIQITLIITGETYPFLHGARIMTDTQFHYGIYFILLPKNVFINKQQAIRRISAAKVRRSLETS